MSRTGLGPLHSRAMTRGSAFVLLIVFGAGVFLAGLELMITAVALPSILDDLADASGGSAWIELRKASWIINGYLLVYILTMPLAGRLTDLWGARRPFIGRPGRLHRRLRAGRRSPRAWTSSSPRGSSRRSVAACWFRSGRPRPPTCSRARIGPVRSGVIGALTFLGMAAGPFVGAAILASVHAEDALEGAGLGGLVAGPLGARLALGLLRQRPDRDDRPDPGLGGVGRLGHAAPPGSGRRRRVRSGSARRCSRLWSA